VIGLAGGMVAARLWAEGPPWDFTVGVGLLAVLAAGAAAVPPALLAALRDPVGVLRTP
jgi:putative ABC transport system permease protein